MLVTDSEKIIKKRDKMLFEGRVKRYNFLESLGIGSEGLSVGGMIAQEYFFEAIHCWIDGLFFATIVMVQMAFEEGLKNAFRGYYDYRDDEKNLNLVNDAGFNQIINLALKEKYITKKQSIQLHKLRKMRNPLVHVKRDKKEGGDFTETSEYSIICKISEIYQVEEGMIPESSAEKEAKKTMNFLKLYPKMFDKIWL